MPAKKQTTVKPVPPTTLAAIAAGVRGDAPDPYQQTRLSPFLAGVLLVVIGLGLAGAL